MKTVLKSVYRHKSFLGLSTAIGLVFLAQTASAQQFNRAIVFGDSLSDNGNLAAVAGGAVPNYLPLTLTRFSNGPVWSEQLFGPATNFFTTLNPNTGNVDFAFGGSRTTGAQTPGPTTQEQIASYILARGGQFQSRDLVTLWAGANNIFQALPIAAGDPMTALAVMTGVANAAAADVGAQVNQLAAAGARTILVANLPNFSTVPQFAGTAAAPLAGASTSAFNAALATTLAAAAAANPGANIITVDTAGLFAAVQANPGAFGLANATAPCVLTPACVGNPALWNSYAFWDGVHPTQAGHAIIAAAAAEYLTVPTRATNISNAIGFTAFGARRTAVLDSMTQLSLLAPAPGKWEYFAFVTGEAGQRNGAFQNGILVSAGVSQAKASEFRLGGLRFGGLYNVGNGWTFGGMASLTTGSIDASAQKFEVDATQISADLLARWKGNTGLFVNLGFGFGIDSYSNLQYRTVGPLKNEASALGQSLSITGEVGYDIVRGAFTLTPQIRTSLVRTSLDRFTERGVVAPVSYDSRVIQGLSGAAELKLSYQFSPTTSGYVLAGYEGYLSASAGDVKGSLPGNSARPFSVAVADPKSQGFVFGAGASMNFGQWTGRLGYRGSFGEKSQTSHAGNLGFSTRF